jgi:hypothetical protein
MSLDIAECDWKVFKELHAIAMDRFFEETVKQMQPLLWTKNKTAQERFWAALDYATERRKLAARLFDDPRRSAAIMMAAALYAREIMTEEELSRFGPETREKIRTIADIGRS